MNDVRDAVTNVAPPAGLNAGPDTGADTGTDTGADTGLDRIEAFGIVLRRVRDEDIDTLCHWRNQPEIRPYMEDSREVTPGILRCWLRKIEGDTSIYPYMVFVEGAPAAYVELKHVDRDAGSCEIGLFLFGKKYFSTPLSYHVLFCYELAMERLGLHTFISRTHTVNTRCIALCRSYAGQCEHRDDTWTVFVHRRPERRRRAYAIARRLGLGEEFVRRLGAPGPCVTGPCVTGPCAPDHA